MMWCPNHPVSSCVAGAAAGPELSVVSCASTSRPSLARRFLVGDSRLSRSCQRALPDGVGGGQPRVAKAGESTGITGSLERYVSESSLSNSDNSSVGVACVGPAPAAVAPLASVFSSPCPLAARVAVAVHARRTVSAMHDVYAHNSWSDTVWNSRCTGGLLPV